MFGPGNGPWGPPTDGAPGRTLLMSKAAPPKRPPPRQPEGTTMSNWINTTVSYLHSRAARDDKGQTAVEYLGIIAVVVAIVLAITGTDIGQSIYDAITEQIAEVTG
ncbi:hypothetical protein GCM10010293_25210 [Streptomyces griseoflavus]|nr:hypothetical protein GCM10010293_25210 [Streptomyces griseoflavus]